MSKLIGLDKRISLSMAGAGLTQKGLAEKLEMSQAAISQWITGAKQPAHDSLEQLSKVLEVPLIWLEHGEGEIPDKLLSGLRGQYKRESGWRFRKEPPDRARDYGSAAIWAFEPDLRSFVREVIQNSLDAATERTINLAFRIISLKGDELANFLDALKWKHLQEHYDAASRSGQKLGQILRYATTLLKERKELLLLRIQEEGTSGLAGPEFGEGNFAALVRNTLHSQKASPTSGGAFGLGKAVLWRCSLFATVLFNSDLKVALPDGKNKTRIIGRSELPWHEIKDTAWAGPGWFGSADQGEEETPAQSYWGNIALGRDLYLDREDLSRSGTSILVVGFHDPLADESRKPADLAKDLESNTADSFWPALCSGKLSVAVEVAEGRKVIDRKTVRPEEHATELVDALKKHQRHELSDKLLKEGDTVREKLSLKLPRRRADPQHGDLDVPVTLLVRRASDNPETRSSSQNSIAMYRGREMIVRYEEAERLCIGARPFHAILLCGTASGDDKQDVAAECFLRSAEPPAHNDWRSTPELKTEYDKGGANAIASLIAQAKEHIRKLVQPPTEDDSDGPLGIKELFKLGHDEPKEKIRVAEATGKLDVKDKTWTVNVTIRIKPDNEGWRARPIILFASETGGGRKVKWKSLQATQDCTIENDWVLIKAGVRRAVFTGVSDPSDYPVDPTLCAITVDLRDADRTGPEEVKQ